MNFELEDILDYMVSRLDMKDNKIRELAKQKQELLEKFNAYREQTIKDKKNDQQT